MTVDICNLSHSRDVNLSDLRLKNITPNTSKNKGMSLYC